MTRRLLEVGDVEMCLEDFGDPAHATAGKVDAAIINVAETIRAGLTWRF